MKRLALPLCLLIACLLPLTACSPDEAAPEEYAAVVNGDIVTADEIGYFSDRLRSDLIGELLNEYGVTYDEAFWQTELDGKTPREILYERALDESIDARLALQLCRDAGIYKDITFAGLKAEAEAYNSAHGGGGAVGLTSIRLDSFYTYYIDTGVMELKNILAEGELAPADEEIESYAAQLEDLPTERDSLQRAAIQALVEDKYTEFFERYKLGSEITVTPFTVSDEG